MKSSTSRQRVESGERADTGIAAMSMDSTVRLLLVDDDEDYYILTSDLLAETQDTTFEIEWASTFDEALREIRSRRHDIYLIDYHLGAQTGLELLRKVLAEGCKTPIIMLTGQGDREVDLLAMQAGAADYLAKEQIETRLLERSIRYAIRRARTQQDMSRLVAILEATTDFVSVVDARGRITYVNASGRVLLGLDESESIMGVHLFDDLQAMWASRLIHHEGLPTARREGAWKGETALLSKGGQEIPVSQLILTHRDDEGHVEFYSTIARDISEQLLASEAKTRLATAIEQVADCILITNTDGIIEYVNPSFEELTGYRQREVLGQHTRILKSGAHKAAYYRELWDTVLAGNVWMGRLTNQKKNTLSYEVDVTITPVRDRDGNIINFVSTQKDVTREREMEEQVRQAQKMEAVGQLAGGTAHDFNNLLTVISGYSCLLKECLPEDDDELQSFVDQVINASNRAAALTKQLLAFGRRQLMEPRFLNLNDLITGMSDVLEKLLGEHIVMRTVFADDLTTVRADPGQLEQVLINMVLNAHHAMESGGTLTLESYNYEVEQSPGYQEGLMRPGHYVVLAITDTGAGMTSEVKSRVFEPFFSTKTPDKGNGLGLSTCFGIIKQSGGDIHVYSEPGQGSTFRIYLPAVQGENVAVENVAVPETKLRTGTETVLVVEDEESLRDLMCGVLKTAGYTVLKATNGLEGLRVFREFQEPIHLVISDVVMPKMGGSEMVGELKFMGMEAEVLFVSGYTNDALQHRGILNADIEYLAKPFSPVDFTRRVRSILDAAQEKAKG